jgi:hypothetical protein
MHMFRKEPDSEAFERVVVGAHQRQPIRILCGGAMRVVWLVWYICGLCLLLALLASAITYHPDIQHLGVVLPAAFGGAALLAGGAAVGLGRLTTTHRAHQSKPLWAGLVAVAVTLTLLLVLVG